MQNGVAVIIHCQFMMPQSLVLCMYQNHQLVLGLQRAPENSEFAPSVQFSLVRASSKNLVCHDKPCSMPKNTHLRELDLSGTVSKVVMIHGDLLTQSRYISKGKFRANIFLISIMYFKLLLSGHKLDVILENKVLQKLNFSKNVNNKKIYFKNVIIQRFG